jgi:D-beta-D-heptose 7-phosphate kinase/D-beta-D-heptose 1-phosphate adenosyltransferase
MIGWSEINHSSFEVTMSEALAYRPPTIDPVMARARKILDGTARFNDRYVPDHNELIQVVEALRSMGCVIAFTTGVWDLLHIGHCDYLQKGKDESAERYPTARVILVVGFDTDAFTKERKGPTRPIVPEDERARVLAHVRAVDIVVPQREADQLFAIIPHEVRIISESTKDLPGLSLIESRCKQLVNLPPQSEVSTTARIRKLALDGGVETLNRVAAKLAAAIEEARRELSQ